MEEALVEAGKCLEYDDVPVGCVIVFHDKIIGRGYNKRNKEKNTLMHAEMIAIDSACKFINDWRLEGCTMYVTLEPCMMCAGAILQSRIEKLVIGTDNPRFGCCGTSINLLNSDKFNHRVKIETGVLKNECSKIISDFFKKLRENEKKDNTF